MNNNKQVIRIIGGDTMERQIMVMRNGSKPAEEHIQAKKEVK